MDDKRHARPDRRIAVVTGANTGLGLETAKALAAGGASVVLAVRNLDKGKRAAATITTASSPTSARPQAACSPHSADFPGSEAEEPLPRCDICRGGANVTVHPLDLASLDSVRNAAADLRTAHDRIDLLINSAGVMYTPRSTTAGYHAYHATRADPAAPPEP